VHHLVEQAAHAVEAAGGVVGWLVNTALSAVVGLVVGAVVVAVVHVLPFGPGHGADDPAEGTGAH
jgi:predicted DNA repair protein MutK